MNIHTGEPLSRNSPPDCMETDDPDCLLPANLAESSQDCDTEAKLALSTPENRLKRSRPDSPDLSESSPPVEILHGASGIEADTEIYGASRFGQFGEYMRRKRAKLQIQNANLEGSVEVGNKNTIFGDLAIYINGWTEPSVQVLRQLIVQHGGTFHAYLDKKSLVTHVITCSLTPAKVREFQHMKVVTPDWLVESAKAGVLLPWQEFLFRPSDRLEAPQGAQTTQKLLPRISSSQAALGSLSAVATSNTTNHATRQAHQPQQSTLPFAPDPPNKIVEPLYTTDPVTAEQAARVPGYAAHASNPNAERVMADPQWRAAHTSVAPDFIEGYYKNSRLHHLSAWKAELKSLVAEAQERAESFITGDKLGTARASPENPGKQGMDASVSMRGAELIMRSPIKGKGKAKAENDDRVIMHCDFDCFFVSAGLVSRPHLRGKPVVVCHSQGGQGGQSSTSEIASSSYEARKFGIKNGMSLQQARKLCPAIITIPYEFERYKQFSLKFYTVLMTYADDLQAVSVDEALIDVTSCVARMGKDDEDPGPTIDPAKDLAEAIRAEVKKGTGCEVSVGVAHNILLARIATRLAKPAGSYHILREDAQSVLASLDISDLHGFGSSIQQKAEEKLGATSLAELAKKSKGVLCDALGKGTGETLYNAIRGIDHRKLESDKPRKSVSCDINYGIRFENNEQVQEFVYRMAQEVERRLNEIGMHGRSVTLKVMKRDPSAPVEAPKFLGHGICDVFNKQSASAGPGGHATSHHKTISEHVWRMLKSFNFDPKDLRGIGIQVQKLEPASGEVHPDHGQAKLPFRAPGNLPGGQELGMSSCNPQDAPVAIHSPLPLGDSDSPENVNTSNVSRGSFLPSFFQVDMDVFNALPEDLRQELEAECKHESVVVADGASPKPSVKLKKSKITVESTSLKRMTQQLRPKNRPVIPDPTENRLLSSRPEPSPVLVSEAELKKLNIDAAVFADLPIDIQREQLALVRQAKAAGVQPINLVQRIVIKPHHKRHSSAAIYRHPPPQANYPRPPSLKQWKKGEKLCFTEAEDVQQMIEGWVEGFRDCPPKPKDVESFSKFLVQSVDGSRSTDVGVEKAAQIVKWWLVLLRKHWASCETAESADDCGPLDSKGATTSESIGMAWWRAFRDVKERVDLAVRKKFGGRLSLR